MDIDSHPLTPQNLAAKVDLVDLAAPFVCRFCLRSDRRFESVEHPIPESLGNDDVVIPRGWICDECNNYFGAKLEAKVLSLPPFSLERTLYSVPSKKARRPRYQGTGFSLEATGYSDRVAIVYEGNKAAVEAIMQGKPLVPSLPPDYDDLIARFLLKVGLELLVTLGADITSPYFDKARRCARYGDGARAWDVAYGLYPRRSDLLHHQRWDDLELVDSRQLYQYEIGVMESSDVMFSFVYSQHVMACNLSREPSTEYILGFNLRNDFPLRSRWTYSR